MSDRRPATPPRRAPHRPTETNSEGPAEGRFGLAGAVIALTLHVTSYAAAASPPVDATIPGDIQSLVPRGWDATSYADGDFNKDGVADRAFLLEPADAQGAAQDPTRGTPLRDKCHNLVLQMGRGDGSYAAPNYLPWSFNQSRFMRHVVPADFWDSCVTSGKVFAVRDTLRFSWDYGEGEWGDGTETQVFRVEGQCLRLIGADYKGSDSFQGEEEHDISANFLTNTRIETHVFIEEDRAGKLRRRKEGPQTSTIEDTGPICANPAPLVAAVVAPQQPPQAPLKQQTRPTSDAENRFRPTSPFAPRAECIVPPLPMVDSTAGAEGPFDRMMEMCGVSETEDSGMCQKPIRTIQLGSAITESGGELESSALLLYAVDDCGLWLRELDLSWETDDRAEQAFPRPRDFPYEVRPWALEDLDRGQYFVVPKQADGSFYLDDQDARFAGITFSGGLRIVPIERGRFRVTAVP